MRATLAWLTAAIVTITAVTESSASQYYNPGIRNFQEVTLRGALGQAQFDGGSGLEVTTRVRSRFDGGLVNGMQLDTYTFDITVWNRSGEAREVVIDYVDITARENYSCIETPHTESGNTSAQRKQVPANTTVSWSASSQFFGQQCGGRPGDTRTPQEWAARVRWIGPAPDGTAGPVTAPGGYGNPGPGNGSGTGGPVPVGGYDGTPATSMSEDELMAELQRFSQQMMEISTRIQSNPGTYDIAQSCSDLEVSICGLGRIADLARPEHPEISAQIDPIMPTYRQMFPQTCDRGLRCENAGAAPTSRRVEMSNPYENFRPPDIGSAVATPAAPRPTGTLNNDNMQGGDLAPSRRCDPASCEALERRLEERAPLPPPPPR